MFSFLDAMICTMGALLVLLHAFARHGQIQIAQKTEARASQSDLKAQREDIEWRNEQLKKSRAQTEAQLAEERLKLSHVEDHERRLREKFRELKIAADEMKRLDTQTAHDREHTQSELEAIKDKVHKAQGAVDDARRNAQHKASAYSVVPYDGPNATQRRPIYIECRGDSVVLQPEGIELAPEDFAGYLGPGNPLASALRASREYLARQTAAGSKAGEPYPLLLVRPEGIEAYYAARTALDSWGSEFGYELVGSDWKLKFPEPDPRLAELTRQVVAEARERQREYAASAPQIARSRNRVTYHARSRGGFAPQGGSRGGRGGSAPGGWDSLGSNWSRRSGVGGSNDDLGGNSSEGSSGAGGALGSSDSAASTGLGQRGAGRMNPQAGAFENGAAGEAGSGPSGEAHGSARSSWGSSGTKGPSADQLGSQSTGADSAGSSSDRASGGNPRFGSSKVGSGGQDSNDGDSSSAGGGDSSGGQASLGSAGSPGGASSPQAGGSPPPSQSNTVSASKKIKSLAKTRGRDWGLPDAAPAAMAATRPIRIECHPDRLVIVPEASNEVPREIRLGANTQESMDELVSNVWQHMKSWGVAGKGLYWRPTLLMDVKPGAADRYADIKASLADSGMDVHERRPQPSAKNPAPKTMRK
jgi:hypothetical protein